MRYRPPTLAAHHPARRVSATLLLSLALVTATPVTAAPPAAEADAAVITDWNAVAAATIAGNPSAFLNYSFVHLAMYNAVVGITGEYEPYRWDKHAPTNASPEAAAAAAAHRILTTYFPTQTATLDGHLTASLAQVADGGPQDKGIAYGVRAADHIIALRANDGRGAAVMIPVADAAGEWRSTPPAGLPFAVPWLGGVTPLALDSYDRFDPGAPPAIGTQLYRDELAEVRAKGAKVGSTRTADEEFLAKYYADVPFGPMEAALRDYVARHPMDISDSARLFAATNTSIAESVGTVWNAKLQNMWWRPITAIREDHDDGDPLTVPDGSWESLINTPPYPEWPSGLSAVVAALSTSLVELTGELDLNLTSPTMGLRHHTSKATMDQEVANARVWSGIHFRTSDDVSLEIGTDVTHYVLDRYFGPAH